MKSVTNRRGCGGIKRSCSELSKKDNERQDHSPQTFFIRTGGRLARINNAHAGPPERVRLRPLPHIENCLNRNSTFTPGETNFHELLVHGEADAEEQKDQNHCYDQISYELPS